MMHACRHLKPEEESYFLALYRDVFPNKTISTANVQSILKTEPAEVWVCEDESNLITPKPLVAFLYFWRVPDGFEVIDVGVHPNFRQKGFGQSLLQSLLIKAQDEKTKVFLEVSAHNSVAYSLYQKLGFKVLQLRKNYYGPKQDAIVMCWP